MKPFCPACLAGPDAIDGHADLGVRTVASSFLTFSCRLCEANWARVVQGGVFTWKHIDAQSARSMSIGMVVPPRSDPYKDPSSR